MPNLTQRATARVRDTAQTALARAIQMIEPVRWGGSRRGCRPASSAAVQVSVEVHVKSGADDVSTQAAALTYAAFLSLVPLIMLGLAVPGSSKRPRLRSRSGTRRSSTRSPGWPR